MKLRLLPAAVGLVSAALLSAPVSAQGPFRVGPQGSPCGSTSFGTACGLSGFSLYNECARVQYILRAYELVGVAPGTPISSLALNVTEFSGATWENVKLSMGHTTLADFNGVQPCGLFGGPCNNSWQPVTQVRAPANWTDLPGLNTFFFDVPFVWNGVDNIIVDIEHTQPSSVPSSPVHLGLEVYFDFGPASTSIATKVNGDSGPGCPLPGPTGNGLARPVFYPGFTLSPSVVVLSPGCANGPGAAPSLSGTLPYIGTLGTLTVSGAAPTTAGVLMLGKQAANPIRLPGGCLYDLADDFFFQFFVTDATGQWSFTDVIPNAPGLRADFQAVLISAVGAPLFQTTNSLRLIIGS